MIRRPSSQRRKLVRSIAALFVGGAVLSSVNGPFVHAATRFWDANNSGAGQTDGAAAWLDADQWWTGTANTTWASGDDAIFGWAGAGGAVTLASPTTVNSLTFKYFTGTYTIGSSGQDITLNNGITKIGGQVGTVNISSPLVLAGAQTWTNNATNPINTNAATTLNGNLTIDGSGTFNATATASVIGGTGNIIKNGTGQFNFSAAGTAPTHTFTGDIVVNGGSIGYQASAVLSGRNVRLTDGYLGARFGSNFTWTGGLGTGADQIQITGGTSGFSGEGATSSSFQIGSAGSTLTWGTTDFNPSVLLLNGDHRMNANGKGSLNNAIDLNGANRTITSTQRTDGANTSGFTVSGAITNGMGTAGLIKTGIGNLILAADNTYNGATTIQSDNSYSGTNPLLVTAPGSITLSGASGRISNTSALNLTSGGTLRMVSTNAQNTVDRINSAAITVNGGGGLWWENAAGANSFAESVGTATVNSGTFNVNLTTNQTAAGTQTLTLPGLTRNGTSALAFSAGGTGPQVSGGQNMIVITGAGTTTAGQIVGPWATTGTSPNVQTDYAVYSSDFVTSLGAAANNDETTWATGNNVNFDSATTLTTTRTVNTLRFSGAANTLDLGANALETYGLLNGGSGLLTISGTGNLTTPTGGGQLHVTTGSNVITAANPIADNGSAVTLVKNGSAAVNTANSNVSTQGTLVLNGVNTYTGDTIINGGTLRIGTNAVANGAKLGGASGNYAGNILINGGALLYISTDANQTLSGVISGDGALLKSYSGTLTLTGNNTYTGKTSIAPATTAGAGILVVSSLNSVVGGTASSSLGAPTTVANGTIDLGGPTNIQGGATLRYVGGGETTDRVVNIQMGANTSRTIDASGTGLLKFTSAFTSVGGTVATTTIQLIGTGDGEITQGLPFGFINLTKNGTGTWTLGGPVESTGNVTVSNGTLIATHPQALGAVTGNGSTSGPTIAGAGILSLRNNSSVTFGVGGVGYNIRNSASGSTINVDRVSGTGSSTITVGTLTTTSTAGGWQQNFTGANGVSLNAGTLTTPLSTATTTHTINNNIATTNGASLTLASINVPSTFATPVLSFNGTGRTNVTGAITQTTSTLALTKDGMGTVALGGANTYTGTTSVIAGTLLLNGDNTAATGAVSVSALATLGGIGTIGGTTTVASTGIVAPGNSAGNLTFAAGADLSAGGVYSWELGALSIINPGTDFDTITVSGGNLALAGTSALTLDFALVGANGPNSANAFWTSSKTWKIVDISGTGTNTGDTNLSTITNATYSSGSFATSVGTGADAGDIFLVFTPGVVAGPSVWQGANNDPWTAAGSWSGSVPNSASAEAKFVSTGGTTANLDMNQTVNKLTFDSTNPHTISGSNTLTLAGTTPTISTAGTNNSTQTVAVNLDLAAGTAISVQGGTLELNSPANAVLGTGVTATVATGATLSLGGAGNALSNGTSTHANVNNSGTLLATSAGKRVGDIDGATGTTTVTAAGATLTANHIRQSTLNIGAGNTVTVAANGGDSGTSTLTNLSIDATGKLDLTNNDLIVDNGNLTTLTAKLASGLDITGSYGSGPGINGITSSTFANDPNFNTVLGIASNADLGYATFSGQTIDSNDVLIKYTYFGDADLNGVVDGATDFDLYITGLTSGGSLGGWLYGDFDYNGTVDSATDFDLYITGLSSQGGPLLTGGGSNLVQAVPEPSTLVFGALGGIGLAVHGLRRRRAAQASHIAR